MADAMMARDEFDDSGEPEDDPDDPPGGATGQAQRCRMEVAYALQSRDFLNIVVAETFSQVNATQGGNWRHRGYCDPGKRIRVRIPGSNIVVFMTNWHGTCSRNNDLVGPVVRTAVQGDYVNYDFPVLRIFNTLYPAQNVYARHLIQININPGTGGLELNTSYAHWGDGHPSILSAYLLHAHEAHFRSYHTCN